MKEYTASRFSAGNLLFPDKMMVSEHEITFIDRKWIGSDTLSISFYQIEAVELLAGLFFVQINVISDGGVRIEARGFHKSDGWEIKKLLDEGRGRARNLRRGD